MSDQKITTEELIARAVDANLPVESLERLIAMRSEMKREHAQSEFAQALANFQADIPPIAKSKTANAGAYRYKYADLSDIQVAISRKMKECGLAYTFDTREEGDTLHVGCIVFHTGGHRERTEFPVPVDRRARMNGAQQIGSALTYGRRYALTASLGIVTADEDDDGQSGGTVDSRRLQPERIKPAGNSPAQNMEASHQELRPGHSGESGAPIIISRAEHRRLEALLSEAKLPRERIKLWIAKRHPDVYPDGASLSSIWATHAKEIEAKIPWFQAQMKPATEEAVAEREKQKQKEISEAIAWAKETFMLVAGKEDFEGVTELLAEQISEEAMRLEAREGPIDREEEKRLNQKRKHHKSLKEYLHSLETNGEKK